MKKILTHPRVLSFAIALLLVVAATLQSRWGAASVPAPLAEILNWLFGYDATVAARLIVSAEFAGAAAIACVGNRTLALAGSATIAFVALACVSRSLRDGGMLWPAIVLALSAALLWLTVQSAPRTKAGARTNKSSRRGFSPAWTALFAITVATATSHLVHIVERTADAAASAERQANAPIAIDLDMHPYEGRRIADTPLPIYLPTLEALVKDSTAFVVFYNPHCGSCHSLFREHFASLRPEMVIAVEIPDADGAVLADTGESEPEPIECAGCERLPLPKGPNWLIASPMVLKLENGFITCVADRFKGNCLEPSE